MCPHHVAEHSQKLYCLWLCMQQLNLNLDCYSCSYRTDPYDVTKWSATIGYNTQRCIVDGKKFVIICPEGALHSSLNKNCSGAMIEQRWNRWKPNTDGWKTDGKPQGTSSRSVFVLGPTSGSMPGSFAWNSHQKSGFSMIRASFPSSGHKQWMQNAAQLEELKFSYSSCSLDFFEL